MLSFHKSDLTIWREALSSYCRRVEGIGGDKLAALDNFVHVELPQAIESRRSPDSAGFIVKSELEKIVDWKLSRGKWRPRLLSMAKALSEESVKSASSSAFAALPDLEAAVKELTVLKGVGPATASAVLAIHSPAVAPFMSDEAMLAAVGGAKEYTLKKYLEYAQCMQKRCKELVDAQMMTGEPGAPEQAAGLSVSDMEKAIWSSVAEGKVKQKKRGQEQPTRGKKQKHS